MDLSTVAGIVTGCVMIIGIMLIKGTLGAFLDFPSFIIVIGGTVAATLISHSFADLLRIPALLRVVLFQPAIDKMQVIELLVGLAEKARREGLLAIEDEVEEMDDPFLKEGIQLVVDGTDPELVRNIMEINLNFLSARHERGQQVFETMGAYAPAFGMIGTLIGLVNMLAELDDPDKVAPGIALALLTTLYGAVLANLIFLPVSRKLKSCSEAELQLKEMMLEGVLSIQAGENPRLVQEKLSAFLSPAERRTAGGAGTEAGGERTIGERAVASDTT